MSCEIERSTFGRIFRQRPAGDDRGDVVVRNCIAGNGARSVVHFAGRAPAIPHRHGHVAADDRPCAALTSALRPAGSARLRSDAPAQ